MVTLRIDRETERPGNFSLALGITSVLLFAIFLYSLHCYSSYFRFEGGEASSEPCFLVPSEFISAVSSVSLFCRSILDSIIDHFADKNPRRPEDFQGTNILNKSFENVNKEGESEAKGKNSKEVNQQRPVVGGSKLRERNPTSFGLKSFQSRTSPNLKRFGKVSDCEGKNTSGKCAPKNEAQKELPGVQERYHDYCVIGAGPAGLQMGYFLHSAGRNYVIYEKDDHVGSFFSRLPRHRKLISINKRHTGRSNAEFNLRHDWNSLLSPRPELLFREFSHDFFPHADSMVAYLKAFATTHGLHVRLKTPITSVDKVDAGQVAATAAWTTHSSRSSDGPSPETDSRQAGRRDEIFLLRHENQDKFACRFLIVATGASLPNSPRFRGSHWTVGYEDAPMDPSFYEGKNVLILGRGNSAFELADSLYSHTNVIHLVSRSRARLAWSTHYVGDLRAVNNNILDNYQLKSLDGLLEASVQDMVLQKRGDRIYVHFPWAPESFKAVNANEVTPELSGKENEMDSFSLRDGYDHVIRCLGFKFDFGLFKNSSLLVPSPGVPKLPAIKYDFESQTQKNLFVVGGASHSLDYRRSSGGFIHGFRYTARVLHRLLEWRNHGLPWPQESHSIRALLNVLLRRINEGSGIYQMFGVLCDVLVFRNGMKDFDFLQEIPVQLLPQLEEMTGRREGSVLVLVMEYGADFSGPDKDTFRTDRATADPLDAHKSNFLHPVLYYYRKVPAERDMLFTWSSARLPRPDRLHHVLEDFLTDWTSPQNHVLPLRRFLEAVTGTDLRHRSAAACLRDALISRRPPEMCSGPPVTTAH